MKDEGNLIERYVYAVASLLPLSQRKDVANELCANIEDMASGYAKGGIVKETDVEAALKALGDPILLARKYATTKRYLIGPAWYDAYTKLLRQLLYIVPAIVAALTLADELARSQGGILNAIISSIGSGITAGIQTAFWVTLVFVFLERNASKSGSLGDVKTAWAPDQLPLLPKKRQIGIMEGVANTILIAGGITWVALSPVLHSLDGAPLFNPELSSFWMPLFFLLAGLTLVHKLFQIKIGNWTTPLMVTNVLLSIAVVTYTLALVTTQQVINPAFLDAAQTSGVAGDLHEAARWLVGITAATTITVFAWEAINSVILNRRLKNSIR